MRRVLFAILAALLAASCAPRAARPEPLDVAAVLPLSGEFTTLGRSVRDGIQLAVDEVNAAPAPAGGRARRVVLRVEDDRGDDAAAEAAVRRLSADTLGVISGILPDVVLGAAQAAEETGIPLLIPAVTDPRLTEGRQWIFRVCFDDRAAGAGMAAYAYRTLGARRAALLYDRAAPYNTAVAQAFRERFAALGGLVTADESFQDERVTTDFSAALERIQRTRPDVLFAPNYYRATAAIASAAKAMGLPAVLLSAEGANSPDLPLLGGDAVEGTAFPVHYLPDDPASAAVAFRRRFRAAYHRDPDAYAALGYDAGRLLLAALRESGVRTRETVRAALALARLDGATGEIAFAGSGEPRKDVVVARIRDGRIAFQARVRP